MNDENVYVVTTEVFDDAPAIQFGQKSFGKSTRSRIGLTLDGQWVTHGYRPPFIPQRLSDFDDPYSSKRGSGKSSKSSLLKLLAQPWSPTRQFEESAPCHSFRKPFKGMTQPSLAEAAVTGVVVCERTTQVNRYTPESSDMCVNCFRRDRFEHICGNYMSLREYSNLGRISVFDSFNTDRVFIDYLRGIGQA